MPDGEDEIVSLKLRTAKGPRVLVRFLPIGASAGRALGELKPLRPNRVPEPDLADAETMDFVFGWSPNGDAPAPGICGTLGYTFWSINRVAWRGDAPGPVDPLAALKRGKAMFCAFATKRRTIIRSICTVCPSVCYSDKRKIASLVTDTALLKSQEVMEVALVADNPGNWVFHCHVIEHQKSGLSGYLRVE
ncbi:multicopper oxidase domain-containing protein [Mesorhizobium sp. M0019]